MPDLAEQLVEQLPGLADEREALLVLVGARAPRRRTSGRRRRCPTPNTTVVRVAASCGQRVHARACSQTAFSCSRRSLRWRSPSGPIVARAAAIILAWPRPIPGVDRNVQEFVFPLLSRPVSRCGNWNGTPLTTPTVAAPSWGAGAWARRWRPPCATPASRVDGPLGRGEPAAAAADAVLLCVPDAEIAAAAARRRARAARRPLLRARPASTCSTALGHEAFAPAPADDRDPRGRRVRRRRRRRRRLHRRARSASPPPSPAASACARSSRRRRRPRRLPRRRLDRLELPRHAGGRRRAPRRHRRRRARRPRPARARHRRELGRRRAPSAR